MTRRYELTDQEWEQIASLLPPEKTNKPGRPPKDNRLMVNAMVWITRSGAPWRDLPERYGPWTTVYSRFRKWIGDGILDNIFRVLCLEAELGGDCSWMPPPSRPTSTVLVQKKGASKRNRAQPRGSKHKNPRSCRRLWVSRIPYAE